MGNKGLNIIFGLALVLILTGIIIAFAILKSDGGKCVNDPLGYAQEKIHNDNALCSCVAYDGFQEVNYCAKKCPLQNPIKNVSYNPTD